MSKTEQDRIKRQLKYYLDKNIEALKSKFYGEDGIWSKYHAFTERFVIESDEIYCKTGFSEDNSKKEVVTDNEANKESTESKKILSIEKYCLGLSHKEPSHSDENNFGAFSWWVESYLKDLGRVGGSSSGIHGFYYSPSKKCYRNAKNEVVSQEIGSDQTEKTSSNNNLQSYFTDGTYRFIKGILGIDNNTEAIKNDYSNCKPNNVVLNKIYYLFKMQELDEQGCASSHLILIFKEESINRILEQLEERNSQIEAIDQNNTVDSSKFDTWASKSNTIYEKIKELLDEDNKSKLSIDNSSVSVENNLFISYCFSCFCWDVLEKQGDLSNKIDELILRGDKNIILTGAPGTGKTFACQSYAREQVLNFITENKITENKDNLEKAEGNQRAYLSVDYFIKTVQFHPGYDYSDFIEGLRPKREGNSIIYDRKDGIFKEFLRKVVDFNTAHKDDNLAESAKFFFIIDEINRGEVSKIFGEAFSMIETDKRAPVDIESEKVTNKVDTQYSSLIEDNDPFQHGFYIPENVYILATMNEIDRSLEAMDFAFRRRFSWLTVEVEDTLNEIIVNSVLDACTNSVSSCMSEIEKSFNALNGLIKDNLGSDYMLGGSYLTSLKNSSKTSVKTLKEELWNNHLEPIIKDYIKGSEDKIEVYKAIFVDSKKEDSKNDAS